MTVPQKLPSENPVTEVSRDSLNELFARDPEDLTAADIAAIVPYFRGRYKSFIIAEEAKAKKAGAPKKKANPAAAVSMDSLLGKPVKG